MVWWLAPSPHSEKVLISSCVEFACSPPDASVFATMIKNMYGVNIQSVSSAKCTDEDLDLVHSGCPLLFRRGSV